MTKIKSIILDCDGVILDSNSAYERMYEELFIKYGVRKVAKDIYPHFGESPRHIMNVFFRGRKDIPIIYKDYINRIKDRNFNKKIKIHHGAKNSIKRMSRKYKVAVVSGALHFRLASTLGRYGLTKYFLSVLGSDDVKNTKPNPEALNKTIKRLKIKKGEAIFVGDAVNDRIAARRAGVRFAAVLTGVLDRKTAKKIKSDYVIPDINHVEGLVERINKKA